MEQLRLALPQEAAACYRIIEAAKEFQREQGFVQWTDGYPNEATIREDLAARRGYALEVDGELAGYLCIDPAGEPAYETIDGAWHTRPPYAVIHRMAFDRRFVGRGLSAAALRLAEDLCREQGTAAIRIDTDPRTGGCSTSLRKTATAAAAPSSSRGAGRWPLTRRCDLRPTKKAAPRAAFLIVRDGGGDQAAGRYRSSARSSSPKRLLYWKARYSSISGV